MRVAWENNVKISILHVEQMFESDFFQLEFAWISACRYSPGVGSQVATVD